MTGSAGRVPYHRAVINFLRHIVLLPLVPVLLILAIEDVGKLAPALGHYPQLAFAPVVMVVPILFPYLLCKFWKVDELSVGPNRNRICDVLDKANAHVRKIMVWHSDRPITNAAVAGLLPQLRILFLTDGLLEKLDGDELEMIVAHEAAHMKYGHPQLIMTFFLVPFCLALVIFEILLREGIVVTGVVELAVIFPVLLLWLILQRMHSRLLEHHADLHACHLIDGPSETLAESRVKKYSANLRKLVSNGEESGQDWWHPSVQSRSRFLFDVQKDSSKQATFEQKVTAINRSIAGGTCFLMLVAAGLFLTRISS